MTGARRSVVPVLWDHGAMAAPLDQAPVWVRDLLGSEREEAAADAEQAALLERVRAGEPGIAVSFEELASRLGLDPTRRVPRRHDSVVQQCEAAQQP